MNFIRFCAKEELIKDKYIDYEFVPVGNYDLLEVKLLHKINDYIVIRAPEGHPRAMSIESGYPIIYEHILVAEKMLGRPLAKNENVHHIDFNRANNLHENLLVMDHGQHRKLHEWINREGLREVFESKDKSHKVRKCGYCDEYLVKNAKYCDLECLEKHRELKKNEKPSKEQLDEILQRMNKTQIANLFGVNRAKVYQWIKEYEDLTEA
ncbi:HNH endonuclease [Bacillus sp. JJ1533]|uniref:HNH endonuclease n=1 Tax=Bacillus sp. JJ1533 TaxID=3122959 RepID=UPI002FFF0301